MCLSVLRSGCTLAITEEAETHGDSVELNLPPQGSEVLTLSCPDESRRVTSIHDLAGHVRIDTPADALEYLRFFSSMMTVHLFEKEEKAMEIFQGEPGDCYSSCLPSERWSALGLKPTTVQTLAEGFRVARNVVRPVPSSVNVSAFRVVVDVLPDGTVEQRSQQPLPLDDLDRARLTFPGYL
ncbi:MAG: hypothetical protein ACOC92_00985 [bacterium]